MTSPTHFWSPVLKPQDEHYHGHHLGCKQEEVLMTCDWQLVSQWVAVSYQDQDLQNRLHFFLQYEPKGATETINKGLPRSAQKATFPQTSVGLEVLLQPQAVALWWPSDRMQVEGRKQRPCLTPSMITTVAWINWEKCCLLLIYNCKGSQCFVHIQQYCFVVV